MINVSDKLNFRYSSIHKVLMNFKSYEYMRMTFFVSDTGDSKFKLSQQHMAFCGLPRLSKKSFFGFHMAQDEGRPLATSSLAVGRFSAKKGSLRSTRGRIVASLRVTRSVAFSTEL